MFFSTIPLCPKKTHLSSESGEFDFNFGEASHLASYCVQPGKLVWCSFRSLESHRLDPQCSGDRNPKHQSTESPCCFSTGLSSKITSSDLTMSIGNHKRPGSRMQLNRETLWSPQSLLQPQCCSSLSNYNEFNGKKCFNLQLGRASYPY